MYNFVCAVKMYTTLKTFFLLTLFLPKIIIASFAPGHRYVKYEDVFISRYFINQFLILLHAYSLLQETTLLL